jgi:hypothetical protein
MAAAVYKQVKSKPGVVEAKIEDEGDLYEVRTARWCCDVLDF